MDFCLSPLISLPLCPQGTGVGDVLITDYPGISYKLITDLLTKDRDNMLALWESIKRKAQLQFISDFTNEMYRKSLICEPELYTYLPGGFTTTHISSGIDTFVVNGNASRYFTIENITLDIVTPGSITVELWLEDEANPAPVLLWTTTETASAPGLFTLASQPATMFPHGNTLKTFKLSWSSATAVANKAARPKRALSWTPKRCGCCPCFPDCAFLTNYNSGLSYRVKCECTFLGIICDNKYKLRHAWGNLLASLLLESAVQSTAHVEAAHMKQAEKKRLAIDPTPSSYIDAYKTELSRVVQSSTINYESGCFSNNKRIKQIFVY